MRRWPVFRAICLAHLIALVVVARPFAQQRGRGAAATPPTSARQGALGDLTGYWVSVVSEDWRLRMLTPPKGDVTGVPVNAQGRKAAEEWDPARDAASNEPCMAYGAPALMRIPGRFHISWEDDETLKVESDAGRQVRRLRFKPSPSQGSITSSLQGQSAASWQREGARGGSLRVVTTGLRAGYLRKNGVPYSDRTVVTEYFDRYLGPGDVPWLTITTVVSDPVYLQREYVVSTDLKKLQDGTTFRPAPCEAGVLFTR